MRRREMISIASSEEPTSCPRSPSANEIPQYAAQSAVGLPYAPSCAPRAEVTQYQATCSEIGALGRPHVLLHHRIKLAAGRRQSLPRAARSCF